MLREIPYPAPGEILLEEFLKPMGITQYRLAKEIGVSQRRIGEIVAGKRAVTAQIPAYGCLASSVPVTVSGSACRPITIRPRPKTPSPMCCRASFVLSACLARCYNRHISGHIVNYGIPTKRRSRATWEQPQNLYLSSQGYFQFVLPLFPIR
jgi:hypothetical protein